MPNTSTRKLLVNIDSVDYSDQVSTCEITSAEADSDGLTFAEANAGGGRDYVLHLVLRQNTDTTALWYKIWSAAGTDVPVIIRPSGGTTAGTATPQFLGTVTIQEPDGVLLGGEANPSATARFTTEVEFPFTAKPTLDVTP